MKAEVNFSWTEPFDWGEWTVVESPSWTIELPDHLNTQHAKIKVKSITKVGESEPQQSDSFTIMSAPPVLSLLGDNPMTILVTSNYVEAGAVAENIFGEKLTEDITMIGEVVYGQPGEYTLTSGCCWKYDTNYTNCIRHQ